MANKNFRLLVATPGATATPASSDADYILDTQLAEAPSVLGPIVRPLQGRTEARPWSVTAVDQSTFITSRLADSSGRMDTLGRIAAVQTQSEGGAWSNLGVGRISDVFLEDVAAYRFTMEDERILERRATIFNTTNTTRLFPGGPHVNYGVFQPPIKGSGIIGGEFGEYRAFVFDNNYPYMPNAVIDTIGNDAVPNPIVSTGSTVGNFDNVRLTVGASTYEVLTFTGEGVSTDAGAIPSPDLVTGIEVVAKNGISYVIWAATTAFALGDSFSSAFLHMMGAPPSPVTPLHIGGSDGIPPATMVQNVLEGDYSSSGTLLPRLSTAAIDTLLLEPIAPVRFRVTKSANMAQFLEDQVYPQAGMVPFVDSSGVITPKSVWMPPSSSGVTFEFTKTNLAEPPEWAHTIRELVTAIKFTYPSEREAAGDTFREVLAPGVGLVTLGGFLTPDVQGADLIRVDEQEGTVRNDRYPTLGPYEITIPLNGYPQQPSFADWIDTAVSNLGGAPRHAKKLIDRIKSEVFARYGDGPIQGSMVAMSTAEGVEPGDFVKLTLETYPNPKTGTRSGTRVVQILSRDLTPAGPNFTYLDAGPSLSAFTAPTVALSTVAADPKHSLTVTVSGLSSQSSAAEFQLQMANHTSAPASASTLWLEQPTTANSSGAYRISQLPSNSTFQARARIIQPDQSRAYKSAWAVAGADKATAAISAPSGIGVTAGGVMSWTVGDAFEPTDIHVDTSSSATAGSSNRVARLRIGGGDRFQIEALSSGDSYMAGVRHSDRYGGFSAADSTTFTAGALPTAPSMLDLEITSKGLQ